MLTSVCVPRPPFGCMMGGIKEPRTFTALFIECMATDMSTSTDKQGFFACVDRWRGTMAPWQRKAKYGEEGGGGG